PFSPSSLAPAPITISPLSLHDALPICRREAAPHLVHSLMHRHGWVGIVVPQHIGHDRGGRGEIRAAQRAVQHRAQVLLELAGHGDRKSTRLNSSHVSISYAVFCLK